METYPVKLPSGYRHVKPGEKIPDNAKNFAVYVGHHMVTVVGIPDSEASDPSEPQGLSAIVKHNIALQRQVMQLKEALALAEARLEAIHHRIVEFDNRKKL